MDNAKAKAPKPTLVPFDFRQSVGDKSDDLLENPIEAAVAVFHAQRLFDFDLSKVTFSGRMDPFGKAQGQRHITIALIEADGTVVQDASIEWHSDVTLHVKPNEGVKVMDSVRRDFITRLREAWLVTNHYPEDFPCSVEVTVLTNGGIELLVIPCD